MPARVSIIVPVYNGGRHILSALATVRAQTFTGWELIVVDDGSTDDTAARLAQSPPDQRQQVIHQANAGRSGARNRGLASAQGDIIAFLDVDDTWNSSYLTQMCAALDQAPGAVAAFCGWQYSDESDRPLPQVVFLTQRDVSRLDQELIWRNSIPSSSLVARRRALLQVGGFDETLDACEDWDLWLRLKSQGTFVAVPRALMRYRAHAESTTENVAVMERDRLRVNARFLGALDEPLADWPALRRQAVGFTYFNAALGYFWQKNAALGRGKVRQAVQVWPGLLDQDEFYYELGCAFQPRGLRGTATGLDLGASASLIQDILSHDRPPSAARSTRAYWGRACLVLARLARNTRDWRGSHTYALRALAYADGRDRLRALRLLARGAVPRAWVRAIGRWRLPARASGPD